LKAPLKATRTKSGASQTGPASEPVIPPLAKKRLIKLIVQDTLEEEEKDEDPLVR